MGASQSHVQACDDDDSRWYVCATWPWHTASRQPMRVVSAANDITEWEPLGDKNAEYYSGDRFFRADHGRGFGGGHGSTVSTQDYATRVCDTTQNKSWWTPWVPSS